MAFQGDSIFWVEVEKVVPNPYQPRRDFDEGKLKELSESVRMYGILQPLTVTRKEIQRDDGAFFTEYELIAGERRLRASKLAGLAQVPVIIRDGDDSEQEKLELAIIENLQREDLNAVDRALAFQQLADTFDMTHDQVAKKVGRSRMYVSNTIRLLLLPEYMLQSLKAGDLSEGHARTLLMLKDRMEEQDVVYREILLKKLSVREVERIVRKIATDKVRKKTWKGTDPHLLDMEKEFTDVLGTRVFINKTDYGGKVTIDYFSEEDLQKLLKLVKSEREGLSAPETKEDGSTVVQAMAAVAAATPLEAVDEPEQAESESPYTATPPDNNEVDPPAQEWQSAENTFAQSAKNETEAVEPVNEAIEAEEVRSDAVEDYVLEQAVSAGAEANRPNPDEQVEISADLQQAVSQQIDKLAEQETSYTPPANPSVNPAQPSEEKKDDESDLYSMKGFSL